MLSSVAALRRRIGVLVLHGVSEMRLRDRRRRAGRQWAGQAGYPDGEARRER